MFEESPKLRNPFPGPVAGAALLALAGPASAAAFSNGSFESPGAAGMRQQITRGLVPSWTYVAATKPGGSLDFYERDGHDGLTAADGAHYVSFGHNRTHGGLIYQDFRTVAGATYTITYSVAEQCGHDPSQNLRAMVANGRQVLAKDNINLSTRFAAGAPITFVARTALTRLTFFDATPAGGGEIANLALDAVAITDSGGPAYDAIPELAPWMLMVLGIAGVGAMIRRSGRGIVSPV